MNSVSARRDASAFLTFFFARTAKTSKASAAGTSTSLAGFSSRGANGERQ